MFDLVGKALTPRIRGPGATGPVVLSEPRVLAVSARRPYARRACVSLEDLARDHTFRPAGKPSPDWLDTYLPWTTPAGRPMRAAPSSTCTGPPPPPGSCPAC